MSRAVAEWVGKTDDSKPPPRVLLRIFQRENGIDYLSGRKIMPGEKWQADHRIALINGGRNCESNLYPVLAKTHAAKTKLDMAEKSHVAARAKSHIGANTPSNQWRRPPKEPKAPLVTASGRTNFARRFQ